MASKTLLNLPFIDSELRTAMQLALLDFGTPHSNADAWARTSLQNNIARATQNMASNPSNFVTDQGINPPKNSGFKITFGLQITVDYKIRWRAHANLGYGNRWGNFGATSSLHFAAYNGGLGVSAHKNDLAVDLTAAVNLTIGSGQGTPLPSYSLNYNSPIPTPNSFQNSLSYGQLLTWNSSINENQFSLDQIQIQREGMIGFRLGDVNVSSNNDTSRLYFGGGTDMGWTGGISVATPFFEVGFQDFSGDYLKGKKDGSGTFNDDELKDVLIEQGKNPFNTRYHRQSPYQKSLNKASTYLRMNRNGYNATLDLIGDAWLQNAIHWAIKDFKFEYNHKNTTIWGGKNW